MKCFARGDLLNLSGSVVLNTVSPVVDHGHNVGEVEALYHHLHEAFVAARAGHELLQRELTCRAGKASIWGY